MNPSPRACSSTTYYTRVLLVLLLAFTMAMAGALPGGSPADAQEDVPTFSVGLDTGGLVGSGWVPGTDVTVTVGDPGDPTETAVGSVDDGGWWRINVDADLAPGTLVTVTDGDTTKEHLVAHLELDVDPATAVVSGEAEPGTTVTVSLLQWPDGPGGPEVIHEEDVVADAEGSWTVDLGAEGFEFDERHMVFVAVVDAEGDSTLLVWSLPSGVCPAPSATPAFPDVSADNVHVDGIDCAAYHEIALGYADGTYRPANGVRRDQMASFIVRTLDTAGHTLPSPDHSFTDIAGNTHEQAIGQLAAADIVLGRTPTDYAPDRTVTRDQMASYLVRALEWAHDTTYTAPKSPFTDIAGNTHEQAIDIAYDLGLTTGRTETTYEPRIDVRRDQMATFLVRLLGHLVDGAEPTPAVFGVVTDVETDAPVAGATIQHQDGQTTTDEDGAYAVVGLDVGDPSLFVYADGYMPKHATFAYEGTPVELDIALVPQTGPPDVAGTVTDAATGEPVDGAEVALFWEDADDRWPSVPSDADGVYRLWGVDVDREFRLRVIGPSHVEEFPGWDAEVVEVTEVLVYDGGDTLIVDIALESP